MHKKKAVATKTESKPVAVSKSAASVTIDYPRPNEKVMPGHYTVRVAASGGTPNVVVSIDGGEFAPCRSAAGYWWFDWQATPGRHSLVARMPENAVETRARRFEVIANGNGNHN
ncbi:MAG: Ig-like domain-containing protein [Elusimicrobia bacterium]|nr:Ig-like domain-containing protein [Elusimicrobiota bacterium]